MHETTEKALNKLRDRHDELATQIAALSTQIAEVNGRTTAVEQLLVRRIQASMPSTEDTSSHRLEEGNGRRRGRADSLEDRVLTAQLRAVCARSRSPAADARKLLDNYTDDTYMPCQWQ